MYIPEAVNLTALLGVHFTGPSAALLPGERKARCGAAAHEALVQSRRNVSVGLAQRQGRGYGLLLVHSHRQRAAEFELHARMMSFIARTQPDGLLHELSLLLVNNDASELLPHGPWHGSTDDPFKLSLIHI